jgi:Uncharacterized conserved protein
MNIINFKRNEIDLPLHTGHAPQWLIRLMLDLSKEITQIIVEEYGTNEFMKRLSDPLWFQSLGCVLGYDWHSSGVTTVVTGVLKTAINNSEFGIIVAGGKGNTSKNTPNELEILLKKINLEDKAEYFKRISKLVAKIDNNLVQDGYDLYHHAIFVDEKKNWAIIQQGMNVEIKYARRYHWFSENITEFLSDPHAGIIGNVKHENVLNMTSKYSEDNRKVTLELIKSGVDKIKKDYKQLIVGPLDSWLGGKNLNLINRYRMPKYVNWDAIRKLHEHNPSDYIQLVEFEGIGKNTIRALALISEIIYGSPASWRDPIKYTFAHGGKDGVPYPVNKKVYENSISILRDAIKRANIRNELKVLAMRRLDKIEYK